jgi:hypothetical protein
MTGKLTSSELDETIDERTQALLDHLERSPAPRIPRCSRPVRSAPARVVDLVLAAALVAVIAWLLFVVLPGRPS